MTLEDLYLIINDRKEKMVKNSYVSTLFRKGIDSIRRKVGEEAVELIIAAKGKRKKRIIAETADLLFHLLVLLAYFKISPDQILAELDRRNRNNSRI